MRSEVHFRAAKGFLFFFFAVFVISCTVLISKQAQAGSVKIKYNGKTYTNTSTKLKVKYRGKTISKSGYHALSIGSAYMVPYDDIFLNGVNAACVYNSAAKSLTISKNEVTLQMTIGKKAALLNGKQVTLSAAPLSVKFVAKNTTKIMVPIASVAKKLHFRYIKSSSAITLEDPLHLSYDDKAVYYSGIKGGLFYNHFLYPLGELPAVKLDDIVYLPAEEVLKMLGFEYSYDAETGEIDIENENIGIHLQTLPGSQQAVLNEEEITLQVPFKKIEDLNNGKTVVAMPAAEIMTLFGYENAWNETEEYFEIRTGDFFRWETELTEEQKEDTETNYLYAVRSYYEVKDKKIGLIHLSVTGSLKEIMQTATVVRSEKILTITIPQSVYLLDKKQFENWKEILSGMVVTTAEDGSVTITLTMADVLEYAYAFKENTLDLEVLYPYPEMPSKELSTYALNIYIPDGLTIDSVTNEDLYENKKFQIIIKGNHVSFFKKNPVIINNNKVTQVSVKKSGGNTVITVATSSLQGYKIYEKGDYFVVKMGTPKKIYSSIIVLDAGHGGHDHGAVHNGLHEKNLTYKIIYTLMKGYFSDNAPDIKVYWTRKTDTFITLAGRAAFASKVGADAFISLHMNSAPNKKANGTEVYYSKYNNGKRFGGITSKKMATLFRNSIVNSVGTKNRGVKQAGFYVMKHNTVPAILIELGFVTGNSDSKKLKKASFQKKAAKAIYSGIEKMFSAYKTGR